MWFLIVVHEYRGLAILSSYIFGTECQGDYFPHNVRSCTDKHYLIKQQSPFIN